jgi:hypothetical protein
MTNERDMNNLFNPFTLWTDLGMRAAEAAVASTQNMTEGADRLTRAAASAEAVDVDDDDSGASDTTNSWASASLGGMADMQRMMWEMTTRSWMQWMSMAGNLMSAGAGVGLARKIAHQPNPLRLVHDSVEHALASPEPKPNRKAAAKRRNSHKR